MNLIIFSKDRAMQLDALLRSIYMFWKDPPEITVLFKASSKKFADGYSRMIEDHPTINMVEEGNFYNQTLSLISLKDPYTMFLVDDDLFVRPFNPLCLSCMDHPEIATFSNRLGNSITYCYSYDDFVDAPVDNEGNLPFIIFNWKNYHDDFGYPMSLDGNIFRTQEILDIVRAYPFNNPNQMESQLSMNPIPKSYMAMFDKPCIIGVPNNRVQDEYKNRNMEVNTAEQLNDMFLQGKLIDLTPFMYGEYNACHVEQEYTFVWRK